MFVSSGHQVLLTSSSSAIYYNIIDVSLLHKRACLHEFVLKYAQKKIKPDI